MNRADLDARNAAVILKHARGLADSDMLATRPLLDDLWHIAVQFAADQVAQHANPAPVVIAASPAATVASGTGSTAHGGPAGPIEPDRSPSARTRTRTRGGPK